MECYICTAVVERHDYGRHVSSHLTVNHHAFPASALPARAPQGSAHYPGRAASSHRLQSIDQVTVHPALASNEPLGKQPMGLDAFQRWFMEYAHDYPKYTTVDGQKRDPGLQDLRQHAKILQGITKREVVQIVNQFEGFRCGDERSACLGLVQKAPLFPGLVAYTFTHLVMCPSRGQFRLDDWSGDISQLKHLVEQWAGYDDTCSILTCSIMKEELLNILLATKVKPEEHKCNPALLDGTAVLSYDILNLAASLALCITGPQRKGILDPRGAQVQKLVEVLHELLESNAELDDCYRRCFFNTLVPLSKGSGYYPRSIFIQGDTISDLERKFQGGTSIVSKGKLGSRVVAVKILGSKNSASLPEYNKYVCNEVIVWRHLRHANCLPLYGIYIIPPEGLERDISIALVSPWMDKGTLLCYLSRYPEANRTKLILDVARGLSYLHIMTPHIAHRDIKPDNILITNKGRACLADFGLVSVFDTADDFHTAASQVQMGGTPNYAAPEIFKVKNKEDKRNVNKRACDIYSLGCTIYAAYTGAAPFAEMGLLDLCVNVVAGKRPEFPVDKMSRDMWSFVSNLWDSEPSKRLTAEMALDWMEEKALQEGVVPELGPLGEDEWGWKRLPNDKSLWSVFI